MKKVILKTIRPKYLVKILNGEQTIILSKNMPKCDLPIEVYICCSKGDVNLYREFIQLWNDNKGNIWMKPYCESTSYFVDKQHLKEYDIKTSSRKQLNGKVVAKFTLNKIDTLYMLDYHRKYGVNFLNDNHIEDDELDKLLEKVCINYKTLEDYLQPGELEKLDYGIGYLWHIENLQIFDKPFELRHFYNKRKCNFIKEKCFDCQHYYQNYSEGYKESCSSPVYSIVNKAPQSWQYVYIGD